MYEARDRYGTLLNIGDTVEDAYTEGWLYEISGIAGMDEIYLVSVEPSPVSFNYSVSSFNYRLKTKATSAFDKWIKEFEGR